MMLPSFLPQDLLSIISTQAKEKRLYLNITQQNLSERSGVSLGVIKKFERLGKISLESLLKIALVLESLEKFQGLFLEPLETEYNNLDELLKEQKRKRARK